MQIIPEKRKIFVPGMSPWQYRTEDDLLFDSLGEAMEHVKAMGYIPRKPVTYEGFTTIQEAINKAVAEKRVVRFLTNTPNELLKKGIDDLKDCRILKPDKNSTDVAVIPPGIEDFDFEDVK